MLSRGKLFDEKIKTAKEGGEEGKIERAELIKKQKKG